MKPNGTIDVEITNTFTKKVEATRLPCLLTENQLFVRFSAGDWRQFDPTNGRQKRLYAGSNYSYRALIDTYVPDGEIRR